MKREISDFYITHIVPDNLPVEGLRKLLFYTATEESLIEGMYYWGLDLKNPFSESDMQKLEMENKVIRILPDPIKVKKGDGLWLNPDGKIFRGNLKNPYENLSKESVFKPRQLTKATQIYNHSIGSHRVPTPRDIMSIS
jgi:hypothetical protein